MSKQFNRRFVSVSTCLALCLVLVGASLAFVPQSAGIARSTTRNAAIVATTVAVLQETSEIRQLSILRPVRSGAQSRSEIERMIVKNLDDQSSPADLHATELALKKQGLAPPDFQYRHFLVKLLTEQVAGYYDPKVRRFYLADWIELEGQKPVMAHELTHALQDQHFNLRRFEKWPKGDSDAELAAHSLIEGDATLAMTLYMAKNPLVALAFVRSLSGNSMSSAQFKQAPRALRESLLFPYDQGFEWANRLYKRGGWKMVSDSFSKLPQSSEQILHPEKYFSYESPLKIALPDIRSELGTSWKRIDYDVNGEWSLYLILDQFLQSPAESRRAASGWAGDRYALYEGPKANAVFLTELTAWDTEGDAHEFFEAYTKRTVRRFLETAEVKRNSERSEVRSWQTNQGPVLIELRGSRVLIVEGTPGGVDPKTLLKTLWQ
ncbi:MAG: hypothetical protein ABI967_06360 [bacterium]